MEEEKTIEFKKNVYFFRPNSERTREDVVNVWTVSYTHVKCRANGRRYGQHKTALETVIEQLLLLALLHTQTAPVNPVGRLRMSPCHLLLHSSRNFRNSVSDSFICFDLLRCQLRKPFWYDIRKSEKENFHPNITLLPNLTVKIWTLTQPVYLNGDEQFTKCMSS